MEEAGTDTVYINDYINDNLQSQQICHLSTSIFLNMYTLPFREVQSKWGAKSWENYQTLKSLQTATIMNTILYFRTEILVQNGCFLIAFLKFYSFY